MTVFRDITFCRPGSERGRSAKRGIAVENASITEIPLIVYCFGTCPVFRFTASRQGQYSYEGSMPSRSARDPSVPGYLFDRLAEVCVDLRVLELGDLYPCSFDDAPFVRVEVRHANGVR